MRKNRGIVLFLVFVMMFTTFSTAFAVEPTTNNKVNSLIEAGLVQGDANGYRLNDTITRAEVITMLVRLQGKEDIAATMKTMPGPFSDVASTHWANGNVNYAAAMGYTNGYPDGTFKPEAPISNAEVVALLVRITGEMSKAEMESALWPTSYIIKAATLGILEDVVIGYNDLSVREKTFEMVYNTREIRPVIETVGNPVEALVVENERVGRMDENSVGVKVLRDQYTNGEGIEAGDNFRIDLSDIFFDGDKLDSEGLLGKVLRVYFDAKGEPVKISIDKGYEYLVGPLTDISATEIEVDEEAFDVSIDTDEREDRFLSLAIYNNKEVDFDGLSGFRSSVSEDEFVRMTVRSGNVLFVEAFDFEDIAPVSEIDGETIYFIDNSRGGAERNLVTRNKDLIVLNYAGEFAVGEFADIDEDDIIHWFTDSKDNIVVVAMDGEENKIEGTFEGISFSRRTDKEPIIEIDEVEIKALVDNGSFSPVYSTLADEGKYYPLTASYVSELEGFYDEEAVAYVDIFGNLQKLVGDEEVDTRFIAVITDVFYREFELALGTGEIDFYDVTRDTEFFKTVGNELVEGAMADFDAYDLVKVLADGSEIVEIEKLTDSESEITNITKNVVDFDGEYFYVDASTTVFALDMVDLDKSEVMSIADFLDILDDTKTIKGYVITDTRDQNVADHIIITEYTKEKAEDTVETVVEITRIRAQGSDYLVTVEDMAGNRETHLIEDKAEILKIKNNEIVVEDIVELVLDEKTDEFVTMTVLLGDDAPVFYIDAVGRGGSRNLNYVVLEDMNGATKTVWVSSRADVFGNYDEGSFVSVGEVDKYDTLSLMRVEADDSEITGAWVTEDTLAVEGFADAVNLIPETVTAEDITLIEDARTVYDELTVAQAGMVTIADYTRLTDAEAAVAVIEADMAAAQAFVDELNALPALVDLVVEDKPDVEAARVTFDALTVDEAAYVDQADVDLLDDYEAKIVELEA